MIDIESHSEGFHLLDSVFEIKLPVVRPLEKIFTIRRDIGELADMNSTAIHQNRIADEMELTIGFIRKHNLGFDIRRIPEPFDVKVRILDGQIVVGIQENPAALAFGFYRRSDVDRSVLGNSAITSRNRPLHKDRYVPGL